MGTYRIYIGGYLNGGFMIMNMIMKYPKYFTEHKGKQIKRIYDYGY